MKVKGNGGYQIIDFEGTSPLTLDVSFFDSAITRGKPLWVSNLVVDGKTYQGVASIKKTLTHIILIIATIQVVIALNDGSTTYGEIGEKDFYIVDVTLNDNLSESDGEKISNAMINVDNKPIIIRSNTSYHFGRGEWLTSTKQTTYFVTNNQDGYLVAPIYDDDTLRIALMLITTTNVTFIYDKTE